MSKEKRQLSLSLLLKVNKIDGDLDFDTVPEAKSVEHLPDNKVRYIFTVDPAGIKQLNVNLISNKGQESHIVIEDITYNNITLNHLDHWGVYTTDSGKQLKSYGYMKEPGTYRFKIRQNPLVHNYINYFSSICKQNQ